VGSRISCLISGVGLGFEQLVVVKKQRRATHVNGRQIEKGGFVIGSGMHWAEWNTHSRA
jgi:hypothetical protein